MKALNTIIKIVTALAAVIGFIYVVATYGKQIVAWAEKMLAKIPQCPECEVVEEVEEVEVPAEEAEEAEEVAEAPVEEEVPAEEPAPEIVVAENEPVAEENDFAE